MFLDETAELLLKAGIFRVFGPLAVFCDYLSEERVLGGGFVIFVTAVKFSIEWSAKLRKRNSTESLHFFHLTSTHDLKAPAITILKGPEISLLLCTTPFIYRRLEKNESKIESNDIYFNFFRSFTFFDENMSNSSTLKFKKN
jgi:hypothetical protein